MTTTRLLLALLAVGASALDAAQLNIPTSHPRLWFGQATRLQQAQAFHTSEPLTLPAYNAFDASTSQYLRALHGVVTGSAQSCQYALRGNPATPPPPSGGVADQGLLGAIMPGPSQPGGFRDAMRQQGEQWLLVYDWCNADLSPTERATLVTRWNGYLQRERDDTAIGHHGEEASNYWSGRVRNFLLWGIGSFHENADAQAWINEALDTRMGVWFVEWYAAFGRGGVFPEGSDYGIVSLSYPIIAYASAADFGFDPYAHTPYFREALYALIYGSTPGPGTIEGTAFSAYSLFPFGDDEHFHEGGGINTRSYLGDFSKFLGVHLAGSANARHALAWRAQADAGTQWLLRTLSAPAAASGDLTDLPLDYYAPGAGVMAMRSGHGPDDTAVHLQLGTPNGMSHRHLDAGNLQMWRKGRWVTRESVGYADRILALGANPGGATVDSDHPVAHNTLLMQGFSTGRWIGSGPWPGQPNFDQPLDFPQVKRVHHAAQFGYVAVDYSLANRNGLDTRLDWPATDRAWREFLFIRPLQALIILDRTRGSSDSQRPYYFTSNWLFNDPQYGQPAFHLPAADITRDFILHFETAPTVIANRVRASAGSASNELITLLPAAPAYRIVNEDVPGDEQAGQHRVELRQTGSADLYFLNVLTAYDAGEVPLSATLSDNGGSWTLALSHPTRGSAVIVLQKGMDSVGGSVAVNNGAPEPLLERVQGISVGPDGPVWEALTLFSNGFE